MKILVVDDHALVREGTQQVLHGLGPCVEVMQASTFAQALEQARQHPELELVLLDYHLPDATGLQALDVLGARFPDLPVLMLSGSASVALMRSVLQAGACGFVTKSGQSAEILDAIRVVLQGGIYLPAELRADADGFEPEDTLESTSLTRRQTLVLLEMVAGKSNREISQSLGVSEETVKSHVTAMLRHFKVPNRTLAVLEAARQGYPALAQSVA